MKNKVEVRYYVGVKGIKENKNNWVAISYPTRKEAQKHYNRISKYGANVRIVKEVIKTTYKVVIKK